MSEKERINVANDLYRLERLKLFVLSNFVKDYRWEFFLMQVSVIDLLYTNVILSYLGLNIKPSTTEYEICNLNEHLDKTLLIEFVFLFLQILI